MRSEEFYKTFLQYPQICTDSRKVTPGCLYFSLKGDHFDGNQFAGDALARGCCFAVVDDPDVAVGPDYVWVPDVLNFLQDLALYHRSQLSVPVIGLTGTNGKTTTKELIRSVLEQKFRVCATSGNHNNHIGVPLTLLSAGQMTEILIVEMGANHPGEIDFLCKIARPTIGLITNIGKAHLEGFGSFEGVVSTKNELYEWIRSNQGELFVNGDDPLLMKLAGDYPGHTYGTAGQVEIRGRSGHRDRYLTVEWQSDHPERSGRIDTHLTGGYNLPNILAAISIGCHFGLDPSQVKAGIESYIPDNMRSQWISTPHNTLFLDAYNANPSSMELALENFASLDLPHPVAILGDMFELGDHATAEHLNIIRKAGQLGFEEILLAGNEFYRLASGFPHEFFVDVTSLKDYLSERKLTGCNILIKGSRGMQLEQLVSYL